MATFCRSRIGRSLDVCRLLSRKAVLVPTRVFSDVPDSRPPAEPSLSVGNTTTHIGVLFDTHKFVKDLEKSGLSPTQSECMMTVLRDALTSSLTAALRGCPSHSDIDLMSTQLQMKVSTASTVIEMLKKTEVATLKKDSEETKEQLKKLKGMFQDEMQRIKSGISLDFNLEKSRMREETTLLHQGIKDTDNKLATMVADMNTKIESQKLEMIKYLAGGIATIITLMLSVVMGIWRLSR